MDYLSRIQLGIDYIETHLDTALPLADVAQAAGLSQWHYQRIFKALTQETLKSYIRSRRLSRSLTHLRQSQWRIADIALESGYETQESYTRAFKAQFHLTPSQYRAADRANQCLPKRIIDIAYLNHLQQQVQLEPEIVDWPPLNLVGLATPYYGVDSAKNNIAETLPPLWDQFIARLREIDSVVAQVGYGVVQQQSAAEEQLLYTAAAEVHQTHPLPPGMRQLELAAQRYAVFAHKGLPQTLDTTVDYIYSNWLVHSGKRHTGTADIEVYGEGYIADSAESIIHYAIPLLGTDPA